MPTADILIPRPSGSPTGFSPFSPVPSRNQYFNGGIALQQSIVLTEAQCMTLNGTPITIVPGVPGKVIVPLWMAKRVTTGTAFAAVITASTRWIGTGIAGPGIRLVANGVARYDDFVPWTLGYSMSTDLRGVGIEIYNAAANPAFAGTFSVPMTLTTMYALLDWAP